MVSCQVELDRRQDLPLPLVTVVVPCYCYSSLLEGAIESVRLQSLNNLECVIVDDGSTDNTREVALKAIAGDRRFLYVKTPNQGVACARNTGIRVGRAPYVCCLDADDRIEPDFLAALVPALEMDYSLGLVYSKIMLVNTVENRSGVGRWPEDCNFDAHLAGHNQVPTCNVFRRVAWERLGGYRQRYAPAGCGTEDAELWLRMGAAGWGIKRVSDKPLFRYTVGGRTTGDPKYKEVDWRVWHPYCEDKQHPFASIAKPKRHSHPVRQYDQPVVSVVIPVGPGHERHIVNALDSLEAQTFRQWEAIVVWDVPTVPDDVLRAFPFIRSVFTIDCETGKEPSKGTGFARNQGAEAARGPFLLFLDADDWLVPDALTSMLTAYSEADGEVAVYSDAFRMCRLSDEERNGARRLDAIVEEHDNGTTLAIHRWREFDWQLAVRQPDMDNKYLWCHMPTLHPTAWFHEIGGFDEQMVSWEDWDYWIRMARHGHDFLYLPEPLFVYNQLASSRVEVGRQNWQSLVEYMRDKYKGEPIMPCPGCGRRRGNAKQVATRRDAGPMRAPARGAYQETAVRGNDEDFVMCRLMDRHRGDHRVIGAHLFPSNIGPFPMRRLKDGWKFDYGTRVSGDRLKVHKLDIDETNIFEPVQDDVAALAQVPRRRAVIPPRPEPLLGAYVVPEPVQVLDESQAVAQVSSAGITEMTELGDRLPLQAEPEPPRFALQTVPGITAEIARQMEADGVDSAEKIVALGVDGLKKYKGIGPTKAETILAAAQTHLSQRREPPRNMDAELEALLR